MPLNYVALLRGINVGGKNRLPMPDMLRLCTDAGCTEVQSYIQSGNLLFNATPEVSDALPAHLSREIESRFGYRVPVVLRTAGEIEEVIRNNPFLQAAASEDTLHVLLLAGLPDPQRVAALDSNRSAPDAFAVLGREIYLQLPNGVARTKLTNDYFDSKLATISTGRNWKTMRKLLQLMAE